MTSLFVITEEDVFCETKVPVAVAYTEALANEYVDNVEDSYGISYTISEIFPPHIVKERVVDK